jgi:DNA-binding XRE family transcriptional regulator
MINHRGRRGEQKIARDLIVLVDCGAFAVCITICYLKSVAIKRWKPENSFMASREARLRQALKDLGIIIRRRRGDIGLSQDELGHLCGLHRTYIGSVERGERNLTLDSLIAVSGALQMSPHELLKRAAL